MSEQEVEFNFKARYYRTDPVSTGTRQVWFVLHGYGQLSQFFIRKFNALQSPDSVVIAPEGLSRFYLEDPASRVVSGNNRVGATWMTREKREVDIHNYITYLNHIYRVEVGMRTDLRVTLLGFSQGAATVSRWAASGQIKFDRLVLWSGVFPPDLQIPEGSKALKSKRVIVVHGTKDPFHTPQHEMELSTMSKQLGIQPEIIAFDGGHEIDEATLRSLAVQ